MTIKIAVTGGKGGVGKSTIAAMLALFLSKNKGSVLLVDTDVESPVQHLLLNIKRTLKKKIETFVPKILYNKCAKCGDCIKVCSEHALYAPPNDYPKLLKDLCSGCKACYYICNYNAIAEEKDAMGYIYEGEIGNIKLIQGELIPGKRQYVTLTIHVLDYARETVSNFDYVVYDTAPGTAANIFSVLREVDVVMAVTEPTRLGANDLEMLLNLSDRLNKTSYIILNKATMPGGKKELITEIAKRRNVNIITEIPFEKEYIEGYVTKKLLEENFSSRYSKYFINVVKTVVNNIA